MCYWLAELKRSEITQATGLYNSFIFLAETDLSDGSFFSWEATVWAAHFTICVSTAAFPQWIIPSVPDTKADRHLFFYFCSFFQFCKYSPPSKPQQHVRPVFQRGGRGWDSGGGAQRGGGPEEHRRSPYVTGPSGRRPRRRRTPAPGPRERRWPTLQPQPVGGQRQRKRRPGEDAAGGGREEKETPAVCVCDALHRLSVQRKAAYWYGQEAAEGKSRVKKEKNSRPNLKAVIQMHFSLIAGISEIHDTNCCSHSRTMLQHPCWSNIQEC